MAAICSLDVTDVDYHSFEHGLETVSSETCWFFVRPRTRTRTRVGRGGRGGTELADALVGEEVTAFAAHHLYPLMDV